MGRILIIEDSESTQKAYREALAATHALSIASGVKQGLIAGTAEEFDLILIDLTLPDGDGFEFCKRLGLLISKQLPPFIFVSGRYDIQDKLTAFAMGAEDYIVKPFDPKELQARVEIRLRRRFSTEDLSHPAKQYGLRIDSKGMRVFLEEAQGVRDLNLTPNEFRLLCLLMSNAGRTLSRSELLKIGWGHDVHVLERTIDRHISGLRRKLGPAADFLEAVSGQGYCWAMRPPLSA